MKRLIRILCMAAIVVGAMGMVSSAQAATGNKVYLSVSYVDQDGKAAEGKGVAQHDPSCCDEAIQTTYTRPYSTHQQLTLYSGHSYIISAEGYRYHASKGEKKNVTVQEDGTFLSNGSAISEVVFEQIAPVLEAPRIVLPMAKTMDGENPMSQRFTFDVWLIPAEELDMLFQDMSPDATLEERYAAMARALDQRTPYHIFQNSGPYGDQVILDIETPKAYLQENQDNLFYVIVRERREAGRPVCFDELIVLSAYDCYKDAKYNPRHPYETYDRPTPVATDEEIDHTEPNEFVEWKASPLYKGMLRSTSMQEIVDPDSISECIPVFENTTCPFYRPGAEETPSVPQTGDNTPVVWLIFALMLSAAIMLVLANNRKKA